MNKIEHESIPSHLTPQEGQFFLRPETRGTYFLARVGPEKFSLINLQDGGRWSTYPEDTELDAFVGKIKEFALITNPFTVTP